MRFMVLVKADKSSEAGVLPTKEMLAEMGRFNEEMVKAGVMLAGEGLQASSKGARLTFRGKGKGKATVTDGPFAESKELVAGFWIIKVASKQEAIDWISRAPFEPGAEVENPADLRDRGLSQRHLPAGGSGEGTGAPRRGQPADVTSPRAGSGFPGSVFTGSAFQVCSGFQGSRCPRVPGSLTAPNAEHGTGTWHLEPEPGTWNRNPEP